MQIKQGSRDNGGAALAEDAETALRNHYELGERYRPKL